MKRFQRLAVLIPGVCLWSCGSQQTLDVRPLHIRTIEEADRDEPLIRGERQRRFHGAVSVAEKGERLGYTYTVLWREDTSADAGEILFEFQQGSTGSRVKTMTHPIAVGETSGRAEFPILGKAYREGGRVLAWRCSLRRGGQVIASRRSYLWE